MLQQKRESERDERTIVGEPPTPAMLLRIGAIKAFPRLVSGFRPGGDWVQTFRVFTCHGYVGQGNDTVGRLRLARHTRAGSGQFQLTVDQKIVHNDGSVHEQHAEATCRDEALAPVVEWKLSSRHQTAEGKPLPEVSSDESGRVEGRTVEFRKRSGSSRRTVSGLVTSDWSLFAAVQQQPFTAASWPVFDVLEGLSLFRSGHRFVYRGPYEWSGGGAPGPLHWFQQFGHGTLPYDYWLDGNHRLLVVSMLARSYILDDRADEAVRQGQEAALRRSGERESRRRDA